MTLNVVYHVGSVGAILRGLLLTYPNRSGRTNSSHTGELLKTTTALFYCKGFFSYLYFHCRAQAFDTSESTHALYAQRAVGFGIQASQLRVFRLKKQFQYNLSTASCTASAGTCTFNDLKSVGRCLYGSSAEMAHVG